MLSGAPPFFLMALFSLTLMHFLLSGVGTCAASAGDAAAAAAASKRPLAMRRSPLQKWLHADWLKIHETPLHWFVQKHHHQYLHTGENSTSQLASACDSWRARRPFLTARTAGLSGEDASLLDSDDGRYVVVKLDKLRWKERRNVRSSLMRHRLEDTHIIDELHMLVYVDSERAAQIRAALEAEDRGVSPLTSLTVLDVYSTPTGARLKLSRAIRFSMHRCGARHDTSAVANKPMEEMDLRWRLPLDVRTALGRENVVERSLQSVSRKTSNVSAKCQWNIISSIAGKGLVRWVLTLSSGGEKEEEKEMDVVCHCSAFINTVVSHPAVRWMEVAIEHVAPLNFYATALVQNGNQDEREPFRPFWDAGIDGSGELVGLADSGVDFDSCFFSDPKESVAIYPEVNHRHRKVISFVPCDLFPGERLIGDKKRGHGTHVAGTLAGHVLDDDENSKYNGVAKGAKIFFTSLGVPSQPLLTLPIDITEVFRPAYKEGAHIFSNSWGFFAPDEYTAVEKSMDALANQMDDALIVFAAGNSPNSGLLTPCRAKNMICIGAHKNTFDPNTQNTIAKFSSPGPTYDHRVKPELVAPGDTITSAFSDGNISTNQCAVVSMRGTSMATAALAGSVALMRQHLRTLENISSPSSALLKALLIHCTVNLNNSRLSGFGRLEMSRFFTPTGVIGWFRDRDSIGHHASKVHHFTLGPNLLDVNEIRVSLVWTDIGSAMEGSAISLVNNLDVLLVDSKGAVYFAGENKTLDTTNVMEQICLPISWELAAGFRVFVYGGSVHEGNNQPYALVVSGPGLSYVDNASIMSGVVCPNNCSGNGNCFGGICECHTGYRFIDCSFCDEEAMCNGHGTCAAKDLQCKCDNEHFADEHCSSCKPGWYGPSCSSNCTCSERGNCNTETGECICQKDKTWGGSGCFSGPNCEYCCEDFAGEKCNMRSYWCREDGWPFEANDTAGGYIEVNGYGTYSPMLVCRWVVKAPRGRIIRLQYLRFEVESPTDIVVLYDDASDEAEPIRVDTGTSAQGLVFLSSSNALAIVFSSRWSHVRKGFLMHYSFEGPNNSNCTVPCVENALCDVWGGGFCVCNEGRAGWDCGVEVGSDSKVIELQEEDKRGATYFTPLVNEELQLNLKHQSPNWVRTDVYLALESSIFTKQQGEMALRAAAIRSTPSGTISIKKEKKIEWTSNCRYARISLSYRLSAPKGELNISFTLLSNASLLSAANGIASYRAAAYLAKSEPQYIYETLVDTDDRLLLISCGSDLSSEVPLSVFEDFLNRKNDTSEGRTGVSAFVAPLLLFVFVASGVFWVPLFFTWRPREGLALAAIPTEEVMVLTSSNVCIGAEDDARIESGDGLFSSISVFSETHDVGETSTGAA
ncbi:putative subtilisin-like serine peptidase [Trypanosoma cruzi]|uniref:Putative subtilisin-like serine peptidase n=1 Tax=Trypanosoma cruzi TaxID=5693 RepID=A0A2V2VUN2_TRYCR|nr:putative subtilisin-like serine peptidase [Trypanosoma cruzi]